jgi:hypothetical protein
MAEPERLVVPTCIGCGAMGEWGTCETGCVERKLELVRAEASDAITEVASRAAEHADAFAAVAGELLREGPTGEERFRSLRDRVRATLAEHPDTARDEEWAEPSEPAVTWWCEQCGGIDAPQPCLGICVWRPIEWVNRTVYERAREQALAQRARERRLRQLLRQIAAVTPRPDHSAENWSAFAARAREALAPARGRSTLSTTATAATTSPAEIR